jgi:PucR family transcriptional regulator, purine catabolism regulatory protein
MSLTLKDVLDLAVMNGAKVLSAQDRLDQLLVESVSVIEIPVENFVRKNELVLSTAIGCGQDPNLFQKFIQDVASAEPCALAIATGRYVKEIPSSILSFAEKVGLPIIEIPWEIRFGDITQAILSEIHSQHRNILRYSEEIQKYLLNLFLNGANLTDIAEYVHTKMDKPILFTDKESTIIGNSSKSENLILNWTHLIKTQGKPAVWNSVQLPDYFMHINVIWFPYQNQNFLQIAIRSTNKIHGYIIFSLPTEVSPESFLELDKLYILEHAATIAALWLQREQAVFQTEMRLKGDFVWNLAKDEIDSWDLVVARAKSLGYDVNRPYVSILGIPEHLDKIFHKLKSNQYSYDQWIHLQYQALADLISQTGEIIQKKVMVTYQQNHLILFLEIPPANVHEHINSFLNLIESKISEYSPEMVVSWGIGENHAGVKNFHESYNEAKIALDIGYRMKGPGHRSTYANTGIYRVLHHLSDNDEMQEMTLSTIGSLVDYDNQKGLDLVMTLNVYIRNKGNVSQTARDLNLHRQSLLYRLQKIETLTGRMLEDPDDLFLLNLTIKLWAMGITSAKETVKNKENLAYAKP